MRQDLPIAGLILFAALSCAHAAPPATPPAAYDLTLDSYAKPALLVKIGPHRRLNLRCSGKGAPAVVLESGAMADSMTWSKVQPLVARSTRVCAYDRAGLGFSDEGPLPRDLDADVADLHALMQAAKIATPAVLVGHSLGSNIVRRYAERWPSEVAALVLLDPPPQHIAEFSAAYVEADDAARAAGLGFYRACEKGADQGQLDAPPPALKACLRGPDPAWSAGLNAAVHRNKSRPAFWRTAISVTEANATLFEQPVSPREHHGDLPLIVLTADAAYADASPGDREALQRAQEATHRRIAATSTRSQRIHVAGASHDVQMDHPDAVAAAIAEAIRQSRH
jgi:pimeloyl-ACP methyl ester carboxylesterase